ncbi:hypothetical protein [Romboutsia sp. 1001216sp1]|uniref:hypothetical protein n=1 Tax=Romboutsia sp. 1001216sp1 TaxID=2986997 RepID=UPI00232C6636|nr:hypothetical protein [Romboutsia sp. 1001216sp1]MDB8804840.1 hypothetical protein [Romboutsia sp. 1001216sp1]MDB8808155.1 hypothetical protein [Romboutsia sp. 1001216sp1]MDB8810486.1 hypothetical protein [Romboutsia sp. 1001216sp1]MDB8816205.1 hypothetical protein [Romboutsia sp. 1001216sp1]MDB8818841.1 hypothetical protein [Romboutsia sp. 1001216sp1]
MKDKYTQKLIEGIDNIDKLDFKFDDFNEDIKLDEKDIENIKNKAYEKIYKSNLKKYKNKKIRTLVASISLILIIGTPTIRALVDHLYKYDISSGKIIKSEEAVYILREPITKKVGDGSITIDSFYIDTKDENIIINETAKNIKGFEYIKSELIVNNKDIMKDTYTKLDENTWTKHTGTYLNNKYNKNDKVKYIIKLRDKNDNITKVEFDIDLIEAKSVEEYNKNVPKDTKNDITLSALTTQENNNLYVDFMAIPKNENMNFEVDNYGNDINKNIGSGIYLIDSNGKKIEGEYVLEGISNNRFKFNTKELEKPYKIEVSSIDIGINREGQKLKSTKVKLPKLKVNEKLEIYKTIDIKDKNNELTFKNSKVIIESVERKILNKEDVYNIKIAYPDNKDNNVKLNYISIDPIPSILGGFKSNFVSSSQDAIKDGMYGNIDIYMSNKGINKPRGTEFNMSPSDYTVNGPWVIKLID